MATVTQRDVEQKLKQVTTRLDEIELERASLFKRRELFATIIAEFFGESVLEPSPEKHATSTEKNVDAKALGELQIADAVDLILPDGEWITARQLCDTLIERGKRCNYKAVRIALERNEKKRYERRSTGALIEWRKLVNSEIKDLPNSIDHQPPTKRVDAKQPTIPDRAEAVIRQRGPLHVTDLFQGMRAAGWKGTGIDSNDTKTLQTSLATRKQRFKRTGANTWDVVLGVGNNGSGPLFTNQ